MITLRKLRSLPPDTRIRKMVRLLDGFVEYGSLPDSSYLDGLFRLIAESQPEISIPLAADDRTADPAVTLRMIDNLRYELRSLLGVSVGDWDLLSPAGFGPARFDPGGFDPGGFVPGGFDPPGPHASPIISVYMESIRSPFNAGSIIRTAAALGVTRIGMSPDCPPADHPRLLRSARDAERSVKIHRFPVSAIGSEWHPLLALETGGRSLGGFTFPRSGTLLVGSEELGLSREALEAAEDRLSIRMSGVKGSLNVGVACGIALHAWSVQAWTTDRPDD